MISRKVNHFLVAFVLIGHSQWMRAATIHVDNTMAYCDTTCVDDDGCIENMIGMCGEEATPYCRIGAAMAASACGDVILVKPSTYVECSQTIGSDLVFPSDPITVKSTCGAAHTIVMPNEDDNTLFTFDASQGPDSVLEGFTLTGINTRSGSPSAISIYDASPTIRGCIILDNTSEDCPGITCVDGAPLITQCTLTGNTNLGTSNDDGGGAMHFEESYPTISYCLVQNNEAVRGGGILGRLGGLPVIDHTRIIGNCATNAAGGILWQTINVAGATMGDCDDACDSVDVLLMNDCVIASNMVDEAMGLQQGGGAWFLGCFRAELYNTTVADNIADEYAGGIYANSCLILNNSILWGNNADDCDQIRLEGVGDAEIMYSDIQGGEPRGDCDGTEGGFDPYANNINSDPGFVDGLYHIGAMSPCVDAGNDGEVISEFDHDGARRICQKAVDMGAYEVQGTVPIDVEPAGGRYISITPTDGSSEVILRGNPWDPFVSCVNVYVQSDGTLDDESDCIADDTTVYAHGREIRPGTKYFIELGSGCTVGASCSVPVTTWIWGDVNGMNGVDNDDNLCTLAKFSGSCSGACASSPPCLYGTDVTGSSCLVSGNVTLDDILAVIGAFGGTEFCEVVGCYVDTCEDDEPTCK